MSEHKRPELRLVRGKRGEAGSGSVRIAVVSPDESPDVDAVVLEEDTWLILSSGVEIAETADHPVRLLTELHEAEPYEPGTVLVRTERPLTLLAVVHDFGAEPCCRPEWVEAALAGIIRLCRERQLRSILLPLFGVRHGRLKPDEAVSAIVRASREGKAGPLSSVLVQAPAGSAAMVRRLLRAEKGR